MAKTSAQRSKEWRLAQISKNPEEFRAKERDRKSTVTSKLSEAEKDKRYDLPANQMALGRLHDILKCMSAEDAQSTGKKKSTSAAATAKPVLSTEAQLEGEDVEEGLRQSTQIKASICSQA